MKEHVVTLIPGDGVGPELAEVARQVIDATGVRIRWEVVEAGAGAVEKNGTPLPEDVLASIRRNKVALKGPVTTPIGKGFRSVNVALRKELDLFACVRPCRTFKGVRSPYRDVDVVIVRENTEDLYAGVEYEEGSPMALTIIADAGGRIAPDSAISIKPISHAGSERIARYAFEYALAHGRQKVTAVTKANIMKYTDGLFLRAAGEVAKGYEGKVLYEERLIDNMCMQLVQQSEIHDVIVLPNLYGDILSDLCAGLVGGLGMTPGANIGKDAAVFEAVHGSAPRFKGLNKLNPTALILSGAMMLDHLGEADAAARLQKAVGDVVEEGRSVTFDLKASPDDPSAVGTKEMGEAVMRKLAQR